MRPTARGWAIAAAALLLYFFADQTQVGWLYVLAAIAAGMCLTALFVPRRMLRRLSLTRRINGVTAPAEFELYAGQPVTIDLELANAGRTPALQVRGVENCLFASAADRTLPFFVPVALSRASVELHYETLCARRGWYEFPPLNLMTRAPFGLFSAHREVTAPTSVLVFPEYRELERLALLDRMPATENTFAHIGTGGEVVGVREYRPGDSRRHIHWRSSARAGRLIVKEFAQETQPGLTIALDLRAASVIGSDENTSLELGIKVAATLARYADRHGLPVTLAANSARWPAPVGPLSWWALMNYLARVQGEGDESFADCLQSFATTFVAAILTAPDHAAVAPLVELRCDGLGVLAVLIDPAPFLPEGGEPSTHAEVVAGTLVAGGVSVRVIGSEPDWERTLCAEDGRA
jgi:uncharacterized protein (DUF58 family)